MTFVGRFEWLQLLMAIGSNDDIHRKKIDHPLPRRGRTVSPCACYGISFDERTYTSFYDEQCAQELIKFVNKSEKWLVVMSPGS